MSGYYNYHPTISHPGSFQVQTASQQKPFYFGGSQVPININPSLGTINGSGIKHIDKKLYIPKTNLRNNHT